MERKSTGQREQDDNMIFGIRPIMEAISAGKEIDRVFIQTGLRNEQIKSIIVSLKAVNVPFKFVPVMKLNRLTRKNHQGVVAYISPISFSKIENVLPGIYEEGRDPFIVILDKITDVRNFGAILRTAESMGVDAVLIPSQGAALLNSGTVKSSAGAIFNLTLCRSDNLKDDIDYLKNSGIKICAATEKGADVYYNTNLSGPISLIMGAEDEGVSPEYLKRADVRAKIPMYGNTESLNVSVAAGVLLCEIARQRNN